MSTSYEVFDVRVAVVNLKGGVGKTTSAIHLATLLGGSSRVLLVDADPQGSALDWSEAAGDALPFTTVALPVRDLKRRLEPLAVGFEHIVIDTPPGDVAITRSALMAVTEAIVPLSPTTIDLARFQPTLDLLADVEELTGSLHYRVLMTRVRSGTRSPSELREALTGRGVAVMTASIPMRETIAASFGQAPEEDATEHYAAVLEELAGVVA